jgi:exopolyphosphatase/guanosine-5'-triphosphate,3'-diphosphate pyrophosphatase
VVTKLAALLRVADALDRSHQARVRDLKVETGPDEAIIYCDYGGNLALKTLALERKADLFQEALGRRVRLERLG